MMTLGYGRLTGHTGSISTKTAYLDAASEKLIDASAKLDGVRAAITHAILTGVIEPCEQLERAQCAMEVRFATVESRLDKLQKSGEQGWEEIRDEIEDAWEDLSYAIKRLVTRFSGESK